MEQYPMINAYAVDDITILQWNGNDSWGEPESGTMVNVKGYIEWKTRLIRNAKGEEVVSTLMVYLPKRKTDNALGRPLMHEDRIIVDAAGALYGIAKYGVVHYGTIQLTDRAIIDIREPKAFSGPHYEVYLA